MWAAWSWIFDCWKYQYCTQEGEQTYPVLHTKSWVCTISFCFAHVLPPSLSQTGTLQCHSLVPVSPVTLRATESWWWSPSQGCLETQTTGEDLTFRWAALGGKNLWVQPSYVIWSHANVVSNEIIWDVCLGMLKSWLESSKDLIVGPGLQRRDLFPEEHQAANLSVHTSRGCIPLTGQLTWDIPSNCNTLIVSDFV